MFWLETLDGAFKHGFLIVLLSHDNIGQHRKTLHSLLET